MIPTEQDKKLKSQLDRLIIENQTEDGSIDISDQLAMRDEILELITADRKRVELEARLQGVSNSCDAYHDLPAPDLKTWFNNEMGDIQEEIVEAQQEEV